MQLSWTDFKQVINDRGLSIQYVVTGNNYWLKALDCYFQVECIIPIDPTHSNTIDFEANYKANGNGKLRQEVVTQYEKDDKRLKLARIESTFDGNNVAECLIEVPSGGRYIAGGYVFTDVFCAGDAITEAVLVDVNNLAGYGAGTILASYSDEGVPEANQGWYLEPYNNNTGYQEIEPIGGYGFLPEGFFLRIRVKRKSGSGATKAYCSVWWGKLE